MNQLILQDNINLVDEQQLSSRAVKRKTKEQVPVTVVVLNEKTSVFRKRGLLKLMYSTPEQFTAVKYEITYISKYDIDHLAKLHFILLTQLYNPKLI